MVDREREGSPKVFTNNFGILSFTLRSQGFSPIFFPFLYCLQNRRLPTAYSRRFWMTFCAPMES